MMSRLTRKLNEGFYVGFVPNVDTLKIKLGQLEDLMEKYNINDLAELKIVLDYYEQIKKVEKITANSEIDTFKEIQDLLTKANTYDKLSNELGCPLDVVCKALKENYIIFKHRVGVNNPIINLETHKVLGLICIDGKFGLELCDGVFGDEFYVDTKDYQKTWWLKGEKSE